jgi:hypothetical protein
VIVRGCLLILLGFALGVILMLVLWPHQPSGTYVPGPASVRVTLSDSYLSKAVQARVQGQTLPTVRNVRISSHPANVLIMSADLSAGPVGTSGSVEVQPLASGGNFAIHVVAMNVAGVPIPSQLGSYLEQAVNSNLAPLLDPHTRVVGVLVTKTGLQVDARYQ